MAPKASKSRPTPCKCSDPACPLGAKAQDIADKTGTRFSTASLILNTAKGAGSLSVIPSGLKETAACLLTLVNLLEGMGEVKGGFKLIIHDVAKLLAVVVRWTREQKEQGRKISKPVKAAIKEFKEEVQAIRDYAEAMNRDRSKWIRFIRGEADKAKVADWRNHLEMSERAFTMQLNLDTNSQVTNIDSLTAAFDKVQLSDIEPDHSLPESELPAPPYQKAPPPRAQTQDAAPHKTHPANGYSNQQNWHHEHHAFSEEPSEYACPQQGGPEPRDDAWQGQHHPRDNRRQYAYEDQGGQYHQDPRYATCDPQYYEPRWGTWQDEYGRWYEGWEPAAYHYTEDYGPQYPQGGGYPHRNGPPQRHATMPAFAMGGRKTVVNNVKSVGNAIIGDNYGFVQQG